MRRADGRRPWETPFAVTWPAYAALTGLVVLGSAAVLGGALVREHLDHHFHPDWAVWAPVTAAVGLGVLGLAGLAVLAQRTPPAPVSRGGTDRDFVPPGTARALLRGEPLDPEQAAGLQQLVDDAASRRRTGAAVIGPMYLALGLVDVFFNRTHGMHWLVIGGLLTVLGAWRLWHQRRVLAAAARRGVTPRTGSPT